MSENHTHTVERKSTGITFHLYPTIVLYIVSHLQLTRKTIPLLGCEIKGLVSSSSKAFTFTVKPVKSNRVHHFAADCEEDYQLWLQTMYLARTPDGRTNRTDTSEACVLQ